MEAQASNVAYQPCRKLSEREDKENIRQSSRKDASVLRETTTQSGNVSGSSDEETSIHTLIEKMNKNLGVGGFKFNAICYHALLQKLTLYDFVSMENFDLSFNICDQLSLWIRPTVKDKNI